MTNANTNVIKIRSSNIDYPFNTDDSVKVVPSNRIIRFSINIVVITSWANSRFALVLDSIYPAVLESYFSDSIAVCITEINLNHACFIIGIHETNKYIRPKVLQRLADCSN